MAIKRIFRRSLAQTRKELLQFRRDPLTVALAFVLPFVALLMYGYATRLEAKDIHIKIFNFDDGKLSREYIDAISATDQFNVSAGEGGDIIAPLDRGEAKASIVIPPEFSRLIKQGKTADVELIIDGTDVNNARVIKNGFFALTQFFMSDHGLRQSRAPIGTAVRLWFNPGRKEPLQIVPGAIALLTWIFPALLSAFALVREKEQGTVLQLYASSITAFELILGKSLAYLAIGMVEAIIVVVAGLAFFSVPFVGSFTAFVICTTLFVFSGVLFGLWAGSKANNQMAAVQICAMIGFLTSMLLSGFIYPIRNITYPISLLSNFVPARYYIEASRDAFVRGGSLLAHWYIPFFLLLLCLLILFSTTRGMSKMQIAK